MRTRLRKRLRERGQMIVDRRLHEDGIRALHREAERQNTPPPPPDAAERRARRAEEQLAAKQSELWDAEDRILELEAEIEAHKRVNEALARRVVEAESGASGEAA